MICAIDARFCFGVWTFIFRWIADHVDCNGSPEKPQKSLRVPLGKGHDHVTSKSLPRGRSTAYAWSLPRYRQAKVAHVYEEMCYRYEPIIVHCFFPLGSRRVEDCRVGVLSIEATNVHELGVRGQLCLCTYTIKIDRQFQGLLILDSTQNACLGTSSGSVHGSLHVFTWR